MTSKTKQIIIALVIIIAAFIGYKMFFVSSDTSSSALVTDNQNQTQFIDGQVILVLLNKLDKVTLDENIFSDKTFTSLQSFKRELEGQVSGRKNPFLPIGVEGSGTILPKVATTTKTR